MLPIERASVVPLHLCLGEALCFHDLWLLKVDVDNCSSPPFFPAALAVMRRNDCSYVPLTQVQWHLFAAIPNRIIRGNAAGIHMI